MFSFITKAPQARRALLFSSVMHVWSDLYFALLIPLLPMIKEDLGLSFKEIGLFRSLFNGATAVFQIPLGLMAETMGEFWLLIGGNIWVAGGLIAMALSPFFMLLLIVSFIGGLGGGAQHPLGSSMVSRAYDDKGRSTAVGTVNFAGDLGKMIAPFVALAVAITFGWRTALVVVGVSGIVFMTLALLTRRSVDIGKPTAVKTELDSATTDGQQTKMGGFVTLSGVGFLDSATRSSSLVFLPFVMEAKGMSSTEFSLMLALLFAGGAVGKFACGWLADRYGSVNVIWGTKGLTAVLLVLSIVTPPLALIPLMIVLGIGLNGTSSVLYAAVADFVPAHRRGRFYGIYYTTNEGGTVIAPLLYGAIADMAGLNVTMVAMGMATIAILPSSLALRKYLTPKTVVSSGGGEQP